MFEQLMSCTATTCPKLYLDIPNCIGHTVDIPGLQMTEYIGIPQDIPGTCGSKFGEPKYYRISQVVSSEWNSLIPEY